MVGDRLFLLCSACGLPLPKVQWYENNTLIDRQPPELILVPTRSPHTTEYTCVASNNAGNMTHTIRRSITVIVTGIVVNLQITGTAYAYLYTIN